MLTLLLGLGLVLANEKSLEKAALMMMTMMLPMVVRLLALLATLLLLAAAATGETDPRRRRLEIAAEHQALLRLYTSTKGNRKWTDK